MEDEFICRGCDRGDVNDELKCVDYESGGVEHGGVPRTGGNHWNRLHLKGSELCGNTSF